MGWSVPRKIFVILFLGALSMAPRNAWAIACVDSQTHALLNTLIDVVKSIEARQADSVVPALQTIEGYTEETLEAVGPASSVVSAGGVGQALASDFINIPETVPQVSDYLDPSKDDRIPDFSDYIQAKRALTDFYGVFKKVERVANSKDPNQALRLVRDLDRVRRTRLATMNAAVTDLMSGHYYSLSQGPTAKANEQRLDQARRGAGNLREDTTALNQSILELLQRVNHLTMLMGQQGLMEGAIRLQDLPTVDPMSTPIPQSTSGATSGTGLNLEAK